MNRSAISLSNALASAEVFIDGDWVESKDQDPHGDVRLVQLADIGDGEYIDKSSRFLTSAKARELRCTFLKPGDVLVARMPDPLGRACIFPGDSKPSVTVVDVCVIRPATTEHDARWLMHALNAPACRRQIAGFASGTTRSRISRSNLAKIVLSIPPVKEQRRIAEVLDRAEALRAKRSAALAQLDTLSQSVFLDMFGDSATNPKGWPKTAFGKLGENQDSKRVPVKSSDREGRKGQYPYYGASGIIDWVDEYIYDGERLLIGEDGANLVVRSTPVAYIARGKYWVNNHAHVIAANGRADLRFLEFFIEGLDLGPFISGTAQPKLNRSNLDRIPVPLPPLALQHDFARRVAAVENLKSTHRASLAELDALFAALQHRAFRGELWP